MKIASNEEIRILAEKFKQMYDEFVRVGYDEETAIFITIEMLKNNE